MRALKDLIRQFTPIEEIILFSSRVFTLGEMDEKGMWHKVIPGDVDKPAPSHLPQSYWAKRSELNVLNNSPTMGFRFITGEMKSSPNVEIQMNDPRGFGFNITPSNLHYLAMYARFEDAHILDELVFAYRKDSLWLVLAKHVQTTKSYLKSKIRVKDAVIGEIYREKSWKGRIAKYIGEYYFVRVANERQPNKTYERKLLIPSEKMATFVTRYDFDDDVAHESYIVWGSNKVIYPVDEVNDFVNNLRNSPGTPSMCDNRVDGSTSFGHDTVYAWIVRDINDPSVRAKMNDLYKLLQDEKNPKLSTSERYNLQMITNTYMGQLQI